MESGSPATPTSLGQSPQCGNCANYSTTPSADQPASSATAHDPVEKTKARGAKEAIEHVILNLEKRIDTLQLTRDT